MKRAAVVFLVLGACNGDNEAPDPCTEANQDVRLGALCSVRANTYEGDGDAGAFIVEIDAGAPGDPDAGDGGTR